MNTGGDLTVTFCALMTVVSMFIGFSLDSHRLLTKCLLTSQAAYVKFFSEYPTNL